MVQIYVKAQNLEAHIIHVVFGLSASIILLKDWEHGAKCFDYNVLYFLHHGLSISTLFLKQSHQWCKATFMTNIHSIDLLVEPRLVDSITRSLGYLCWLHSSSNAYKRYQGLRCEEDYMVPLRIWPNPLCRGILSMDHIQPAKHITGDRTWVHLPSRVCGDIFGLRSGLEDLYHRYFLSKIYLDLKIQTTSALTTSLRFHDECSHLALLKLGLEIVVISG